MVYHSGSRLKGFLANRLLMFRTDRPDEWMMDEFIQIAEDMNNHIEALENLICECTEDGELDSRLFISYIEHFLGKNKEG